MFDLYLPIFPASYLSHSVITTVWIGIMVIAFFNLRFGWIFTGLVVPGYLTPLLLIKPLSVFIILFESVITYQLIYLLSEVAARHGLWTNFFGRDRFFAILLGSVAVRLFFDGWALPWLNGYSIDQFGINLDMQDSLHSFGLIIVALIANHLWKPKLLHGLFQLLVTLGITYIIIRYFFIAYTNFSLSNIGYLYEDVAGSILASPKSYIILIVTAFIASRMNLFYGWEFNGILVPSLLALQWYQPTKILTSFFEAYLILLFAILVLKLPILKNISMEGARKIVFFFNIGFFYKIILSFAIIYFFPEYKVSDYFGFGYLLSTLIAVKMYDKVSIPLFTRATLQTSLMSIFIATTIGYMLTLLPNSSFFYTKPLSTLPLTQDEYTDKNLMFYLEEQKVHLYGGRSQSIIQKPTPAELSLFERALSLIDEGFTAHKDEIQNLLRQVHFKLQILEDHYLILTQEEGYHGWGMYVVDLKQTHELLIEVPYPLETSDIMESASVLMKLSKAKVLSLSGVPLHIEGKLTSDTFNNYYSIYHTIHKHYARNSVVQVRDLNAKLHKRFQLKTHVDESAPLLFVKGYMPKQFELSLLKEQLQTLKVRWDDSTETSIQKKSMNNGFAELYLTKKDRQLLITSQFYFLDGLIQDASINSIEGLLQTWLLDKKIEIAKKGSEKYVKPTAQELLFFDNVILTPLYHILTSWEQNNPSMNSMKSELLSIAFAAKSLGYTLTWYEDISQHKSYIILHETPHSHRRYWGTYVFKLGQVENIMIQTPRPFYELHTFEYSLELFTQLNAKVLLLNGSHPLANSDHSADVMLLENKENIFNLFSQVIYRENKKISMNALQIRGMQQETLFEIPTAVLAFHEIFDTIDQLNKEERLIYYYLQQHMPLSIYDGSANSAGYDALALQSLYLNESVNNTFNILWIPSSIRSQYKQLSDNDLKVQQFQSIGIEVNEQSLTETLATLEPTQPQLCHKEIFSHLVNYLNSRDITELESLNKRSNVTVKLLIDTHNTQPYILLQVPDTNQLFGIAKLNAYPPYAIDTVHSSQTLDESANLFYRNTSALLKMEETCEN